MAEPEAINFESAGDCKSFSACLDQSFSACSDQLGIVKRLIVAGSGRLFLDP